MKRIASLVRLLRFCWIYSNFAQRLWMVVCFAVFVVSVVALVLSFPALAEIQSVRQFVWPAICFVSSLVSLAGTVWDFRNAWRDDREMVLFKDRTDSAKALFSGRISQVVLPRNSYGDIFTVERLGSRRDFIAFSPKLDEKLRHGGKIAGRITDLRKIPIWRRINKNLPRCLTLLSMKQSKNNDGRFFNESKIAVTGAKFLGEENAIDFTVAKTWYYASYLTNELYKGEIRRPKCDNAQDGETDDWSPFVEEFAPDGGKIETLRDFDGTLSAHIGVNTLGVTRDGYVCIWRQKRGEHSRELAAPTGSGSLDWYDLGAQALKSSGPVDLGRAVTLGAERELTEESFDEGTRKLLKDRRLETRVIGFFRWGVRGGLPGFACVTKIPLLYGDIQPKIDNKTNEIVKDRDLVFRIGREESGRELADKIRLFKNTKSCSVPLIACLNMLGDALEDDSCDLLAWLRSEK